ncbi:hypothetical protein BDP55DRAFT_626211 [Colletotrichum godetiae]|uniref:Uncharacterized protein n=1 Tax=Colletotrichum godetiae TaxID=1209918 RepID=A0AAJ0AYN5_9PEZI|nr:uncharacterized protein BDP55DRAFT_626211 [Colletotrichum godetiae]KAK1700653.1 hypothetical protein BDP55DRAFT_626211 [Colletotrichum godetiae]
MLDGYECDPDDKMRGPSMDIDEKSTAFSQAQISTPPAATRRHTINTMMTTTIIPEPTPPVADPQRRFSWLPRSATPSLRSPTFRRRTASPFDDDDYSYAESNPFGEDFREQNEQAARDWDREHGHDQGENPFEDCEYELPPAAVKKDGTWTKFKKAMSPRRAISKWKYRKVKHEGMRPGPDDPDHGEDGRHQGQVS